MTQIDALNIVRGIEEKYAAAFRSRDARALAGLLTPCATALSEWGDVMHGQADIERKLTRAFAMMRGDLDVTLTPVYAAPVADGVIVTHGRAEKTLNGVSETLYYTRTLIRQGDGSWKIAAVQVAPASKEPDPRK